ncbi:S8 family serine peptidase [Deinococcus xianganensis]|uniref:S8 family serine peptidase n=1 Tax=Deinococcus xianganensis TaxID=1507289 RepID=A0A6I4YNU8_9DEIO|nr:S8 family serine peptidase [Deinococcus xianganensis]
MNPSRILPIVTLTALLAACSQNGSMPEAGQAPLLGTDTPGAIPGQYIVVFKNGERLSSQSLVSQLNLDPAGVRVQHVYTQVLQGFAATLSPANLQKLRADPRVKYVEQDGVATANVIQTSPPWGLDRIDQRSRPLNGQYVYGDTAPGVTAYIIDTGIRTTHTDFGGRAVWGTNTTGDGTNTDCNGHGTHVAGTTGGSWAGVAKGVRLVAVKVLGCSGSGTWSGVIAGINWAASNRTGPAVANMSLGGGTNQSIDDAVTGAVNSGLTMVVAAGNNGANACNYSPARTPSAITVGNTTSSDARASSSNWGSCLDLFAPGTDIASDYSTSDTATATLTGTSMASPHVAGAAALILSANPGFTPAQVASTLIANATTGVVSGAGTGSPNRLLFVPQPVQNSAPTASFTQTVSGLSATLTSTSTDPDNNITAYSWNFGDGTTATGSSVSKTYAAAGTYTVTLTVTDAGGLSNTTSQTLTVSSGGNALPVAGFTKTVTRLLGRVVANSTSYDPDGSIVSYLWDMGDGMTYTTPSVDHYYDMDGSYVIRLTVTDNSGATATTTQNVSVLPNGGCLRTVGGEAPDLIACP